MNYENLNNFINWANKGTNSIEDLKNEYGWNMDFILKVLYAELIDIMCELSENGEIHNSFELADNRTLEDLTLTIMKHEHIRKAWHELINNNSTDYRQILELSKYMALEQLA